MEDMLLRAAVEAVTRAGKLTRKVQESIVSNASSTYTKEDRSPVTVADYAAQILINATLRKRFPDIPIVGEEESADLMRGGLGERVWDLVKEEAQADDAIKSQDDLTVLLDQGSFAGSATKSMSIVLQ